MEIEDRVWELIRKYESVVDVVPPSWTPNEANCENMRENMRERSDEDMSILAFKREMTYYFLMEELIKE